MVNHERELLKTTDIEKKDRLVRCLVNAGISYLEKWEKVPFFRRREFDGAREVCVIVINDNQYERALLILEEVNNGTAGMNDGRKKIKALLDGEKKNSGKKKADNSDFLDEEDT